MLDQTHTSPAFDSAPKESERIRGCLFGNSNDNRAHRFSATDGMIYCEQCGEIRPLVVKAAAPAQ